MKGVYKKPYDEEFRKSAVELLLSNGKPLSQLAAELGVCADSLRRWRDKQMGKNVQGVQMGQSGPLPQQMAEEIQRLRRELERVTRQRDILKKAAGILSETSPGGMP